LIACSEIAFYSIILAELTHNPICVTKIF